MASATWVQEGLIVWPLFVKWVVSVFVFDIKPEIKYG